MLLKIELKKSYEVALVAIMTAVAVVGRMVLQAIPNVQPATFLIVITGLIFGKRIGMELGFVIALVTGLLTGFGTWTLFQIGGWVFVGAISGLLGRRGYRVSKPVQVAWFILSAFVYGFIASLSILLYIPLDAFIPAYISGLPYDVYHALGNIAMMATIPVIVPELEKFRIKGERLTIA